MAASPEQPNDLNDQVDRIVAYAATPEGGINYSQAWPLLRGFLAEHPEYKVLDKATTQLLERHKDRHKVSHEPNGQLALPFAFDPHAVYLLGDNEAWFQAKARPAHIRRAMLIHQKQLTAQMVAGTQWLTGQTELLGHFQSEDETVIDVLRRDFDYQG